MKRRKKYAPSLSRIQSAITNGRHILANTDHRSGPMRRLRDLVQYHIAQLGGEEAITESERRLIMRCAMITTQCEMLDVKFAGNDGEASRLDLETYQRLTNTLRRTLESLGLSRRQRTVTPSLDQYLGKEAAE